MMPELRSVVPAAGRHYGQPDVTKNLQGSSLPRHTTVGQQRSMAPDGGPEPTSDPPQSS